MPIRGRVALVTGGGKGLGEAIARRLAQEGARVAIVGRDREALSRVASEIDAVAVPFDLLRADAAAGIEARVGELLGPVEILVQNAGIALSAPLGKTDDEAWERIMTMNVTVPFRLARHFAPAMVAAGFGRIVHVASNAGLTGYAYTAAYCASKHALVGLTRALAAELARTSVTVNAVCPGFIDTAMTERTIENIAQKTGRSAPDARKALEALSPQRRLVSTAEVAHVVGMLCANEAQAVNGQAIAIDGGQVMS